MYTGDDTTGGAATHRRAFLMALGVAGVAGS